MCVLQRTVLQVAALQRGLAVAIAVVLGTVCTRTFCSIAACVCSSSSSGSSNSHSVYSQMKCKYKSNFISQNESACMCVSVSSEQDECVYERQ